jgi:uncharacterized alkaline shock family protein YloU
VSNSRPLQFAGPDDLVGLATMVAASVQQCPAVAALTAGRFGKFGTFLAGRHVTGVSVDADRIDIGVVARFGVPVGDLSVQVRAAVAPLVGGRSVNIRVEDVQIPGEAVTDPGPPALPQAG